MRDVETLKGLLERVRSAAGTDRDLDRALHKALGFREDRAVYQGVLWNWYTGEVSSARALSAAVLPNFWISSGLCSLSGHASTGPDYNGPAGDTLRATWPEERFHAGFHSDLGPGDGAHREAYAILDVTLQALIAQAQEAPRHGE